MSDYPGQESRGIDARDVRPGDVIWNPHGGFRGRAEVTSEARERPDGTIEFDCADGRTGHFRPQFRLRLDREAMARRDAEREAAAAGRDMPGHEVPAGPAEVVREYRDAAGSLRAAEMEAPDGARFTVSQPRGNVSGADPQVWRVRRLTAWSGSSARGTAVVMSARTARTTRSGTPALACLRKTPRGRPGSEALLE